MSNTARQPTVTKIWIAEGCIVCNLCEDTCPEVFRVLPDTCTVLESAEQYHRTRSLQIIQAAGECPVDVIRVGGFNEPA